MIAISGDKLANLLPLNSNIDATDLATPNTYKRSPLLHHPETMRLRA